MTDLGYASRTARDLDYVRALTVVTRMLRANAIAKRDVEDLAQETMVRLVASSRRSPVHDLVGLAVAIAKRVLLESARDRRRSRVLRDREVMLVDMAEHDAALLSRSWRFRRREVADLLSLHTSLDSEVIEFALLVLVDDLTVKEAANALGYTLFEARSLRERIRREFLKVAVNSGVLRSLSV